MKKISVVYHSGYGHTTNQAKGIVSGIDSIDNVTANLLFMPPKGRLMGFANVFAPNRTNLTQFERYRLS